MFLKYFQGKFNFQGLFKTVLYIQVLFKPMRTLTVYHNKDVFHNTTIMTFFIFCFNVLCPVQVFNFVLAIRTNMSYDMTLRLLDKVLKNSLEDIIKVVNILSNH